MNNTRDPGRKENGPTTGWQGSAAAMDRWYAQQAQGAGAVATNLMFEKTQIGPGKRVLDVGAGSGNETIRMAEMVGPSGFVLATDISEDMLQSATRKVHGAGLGNVDLKIMDAADLDVPPRSFDAAISRMGLMLFPDPNGALHCMWQALKTGGRVGAMVFSLPEHNPMQEIPATVIRDKLGLPAPDPDRPGYSRLSAAGLLDAMLEEAGFVEVDVVPIGGDRQMSANDLREFVTDRSGITRPLLAQVDGKKKEEILDAVLQSMSPYLADDGYVIPQEFLVASGLKAD